MIEEKAVDTPITEEEMKLYGHRLSILKMRLMANQFVTDEFLKDFMFIPIPTPMTDPKGNVIMGAASPTQVMNETEEILADNTKALRALKNNGIIVVGG